MASVTMTIDDFIEGFTALGEFLRRPPRVDASLTCADGQLVIITEGMEIGIPIDGYFSGTAWLSGPTLISLTQLARKHPPLSGVVIDPIEGIIRVGSTTVPLRFDTASRSGGILVPKDAPLLFWLELPRRHSQEEIKAAQLEDLVAKAIRTKGALIAKAAKHLVPLGVSRDALIEFVEKQIKA